MRTPMPKVFISHSTHDIRFAERVRDLIRQAFQLVGEDDIRLTPLPEHAFRGGEDILEGIRREVGGARVLIALLSSNSIERSYVQFEVFARVFTKKSLIPLMLPGTPITVLREPLNRSVALSANNLPEAYRLIPTLKSALRKEPAPFAHYVEYLEKLLPRRKAAAEQQFTGLLKREFAQFREGAQRISHPVQRECLTAARLAVQDAAGVIDRHWNRGQHRIEGLDLVAKNRSAPGWFPAFTSLVSRKIVRRLKESRDIPAFRILVDDEGVVPDPGANDNYTWVVDSIDGSRQMVRSLPLFTVSIALVDTKCAPVLGLIYAPVTGELFFAVRGVGAYLNNWETRLQLGNLDGAVRERAVVHMEFPNSSTKAKPELRKLIDGAGRIFEEVYRVRGLGVGTLGLAYTAKGAFDAYVTFASGTTNCDVLSGQLLVEEAGGDVRKTCLPCDGLDPELGVVRLLAGRRNVVSRLLELPEVGRLFKAGGK